MMRSIAPNLLTVQVVRWDSTMFWLLLLACVRLRCLSTLARKLGVVFWAIWRFVAYSYIMFVLQFSGDVVVRYHLLPELLVGWHLFTYLKFGRFDKGLVLAGAPCVVVSGSQGFFLAQLHGIGRRCVIPYVASLVLVIGDAVVDAFLFGMAFAPRDPK